jgi:hypothetical protein
LVGGFNTSGEIDGRWEAEESILLADDEFRTKSLRLPGVET